jgi:predicted house-cleaning noncanonical NTP pyrophosphatase (MazG superfamily)
MIKVYNKLVRDRIPEIIEAEGKKLKTRILSGEEYLEELLKKLDEELQELKEARSIEELADIQEIVYSLANTIGSGKEDLESVRAKKAQERGAFMNKIFLEEAEE